MAEFGHGFLRLETLNIITSLGNPAALELCYAQLANTAQPQETRARCRNRTTGVLETKSKGLQELVHSLQITWEAATWADLQFAHNEIAQDSSTAVNDPNVADVPATTFTIVDPEITTANEASVRAYLPQRESGGLPQLMKKVAVAPAARDEYQVDGASNSIIFHSTAEGAEAVYFYDKSYTAIQTIGLETNFERFGDFQAWFTSYGDGDIPEGITLWFPRLTFNAGPPVVDRNNSPATYQKTFESPSVSGRDIPYVMYNRDFATAA